MPKGIKPKSAIDKVLHDFFKDNGFTLKKSIPPEHYAYIRTVCSVTQKLMFDFDWKPDSLVQEGYRFGSIYPLHDLRRYKRDDWKIYMHKLTVRITGNKKGGNLSGIITYKKYPHLCKDQREYTSEQKKEWETVFRTDPFYNMYFLTQQELEETLQLARQALEVYALPYLEEEDDWPGDNKGVK